MPALIAAPWLGTAIAGVAGAGASVVGAKMMSGATNDAATAESAAQKYAADRETAANAEATAFARQQGENAYQNTEAARKGNYGMYAAAQRRLGSIGSLIGAGPREIPDYVPGVDPHFDGSGGPNVSAPSSATGATGGDAVTQALLDNYKALGVAPTGPGTGPTDIAYFTQQAKSSLAAGERPLSYWLGPQGRVAQELAKAKGGAPTAPGSAASYLLPPTKTVYAQTPIAPALPMPGSAASYLN